MCVCVLSYCSKHYNTAVQWAVQFYGVGRRGGKYKNISLLNLNLAFTKHWARDLFAGLAKSFSHCFVPQTRHTCIISCTFLVAFLPTSSKMETKLGRTARSAELRRQWGSLTFLTLPQTSTPPPSPPLRYTKLFIFKRLNPLMSSRNNCSYVFFF